MSIRSFKRVRVTFGAALVFTAGAILFAQSGVSVKNPNPISGAFESLNPAEFQGGLGVESNFSCVTGTANQPGIFAGNFLLSCGPEVPHNETSIAVNPLNPNNIVGAFHTYVLVANGNAFHTRIVATPSV